MIRFVSKLVKQVRENQKKRQACKDLNKFTDRELWDIGLTRSDIYNRVYDLDKVRKSGW